MVRPSVSASLILVHNPLIILMRRIIHVIYSLFSLFPCFCLAGVDYRHPALGGCFGKGCKIAYGYDLVGDDYNGTADTIKEDDDPLDNCPSDAGNV